MEERQSRRRMRRVRYEANVYIRGPRQDRAVVARAHNLSAEGIAVSALELPGEGEEVECRLILAGRRTKLRGRVAWIHRAPPAQRALPLGGGIQFISLEGPERALLNRLVDSASDGPQLCEVWVPGMDQPLPMRGLIGTDEVKLGMRLPQLAVGMPVRISFVHRGVSESRQGSIEAVRFLPGDRETMSRVALQVSTPRPRQGAGLIRNQPDSGLPPEDQGPGTQSMLVDLAVLSVPPSSVSGPLPGINVPPPIDDQTPVIPYEPPPLPGHAPLSGALADRRIRWALPAAVALAGALVLGLFLAGSDDKPAPSATRPLPAPAPAPPPPRRPASFTPPTSIEPIPTRPAAAGAGAAAPKPSGKAVRKKSRKPGGRAPILR